MPIEVKHGSQATGLAGAFAGGRERSRSQRSALGTRVLLEQARRLEAARRQAASFAAGREKQEAAADIRADREDQLAGIRAAREDQLAGIKTRREGQLAVIEALRDERLAGYDSELEKEKAGYKSELEKENYLRDEKKRADELRIEREQYDWEKTREQEEADAAYEAKADAIDKALEDGKINEYEHDEMQRQLIAKQSGVKKVKRAQFPKGQGLGQAWTDKDGRTWSRNMDGNIKLEASIDRAELMSQAVEYVDSYQSEVPDKKDPKEMRPITLAERNRLVEERLKYLLRNALPQSLDPGAPSPGDTESPPGSPTPDAPSPGDTESPPGSPTHDPNSYRSVWNMQHSRLNDEKFEAEEAFKEITGAPPLGAEGVTRNINPDGDLVLEANKILEPEDVKNIQHAEAIIFALEAEIELEEKRLSKMRYPDGRLPAHTRLAPVYATSGSLARENIKTFKAKIEAMKARKKHLKEEAENRVHEIDAARASIEKFRKDRDEIRYHSKEPGK